MNTKLLDQKEYFNKIATIYHEHAENNLGSIIKFKKVTAKFIQGNVLDIGSGGIIGYEIKKARKIIIADIAPETLSHPLRVKGRRLMPFRSKKLKTRVANVLKTPFGNSQFDTTIMITTAHHLSVRSLKKTKYNLTRALKEINRVTKMGGIFIIHECFYNPILKIFQEIFFEPTYYLLNLFNKPLPYFMSHSQLSKYLKGCGFQIIKIINTPASKKTYLPIFPSISPPGWLWDKILRSDIFICRKEKAVKQSQRASHTKEVKNEMAPFLT